MEDYPPPVCELWPENWPAINLYTEISTQWRTGAGGVIGLDYNIVFHEIERRGASGVEYDDLMWCIRAIEAEALKILNRPA